VVASQLGGNYWVRVIDFALLYIMLALGLNIVVGYTGLLDMGFIAFYAVGAYLAALLASRTCWRYSRSSPSGSRTGCTPPGC
jgi:branched-chain amino acid transport system permease protein